jgi:two-component system alkaline phosphatase synthesis response regulator PhoP
MTLNKRILVVDDEPDFCSALQCNLEKQGFEVDVAFDGGECLSKVKADPPDAIILDIMMPDMDGCAVCKAIKTDKRLQAIPIVMLTAAVAPVTAVLYSPDGGGAARADDFLPKPVSMDDITRSLKHLLRI